MVFINPRYDNKYYAELYKKNYHKTGPNSEVSIKEILKNKKVDKNIPERLIKHVNAPVSKILDVGSGMGWNVDLVGKEFNCDHLACIEPQDICAKNIKNTVGADLIARDVGSDWHKEFKKTFDIIIMRHVLEHLLDPITILGKIKYVLKDNGSLYISVPDMFNPINPLNGYFFRAVHLYYFCHETLLSTTHKAGLKPVELKSDGNELWGVFGNGTFNYEPTSVYKAQLKIIRKTKTNHIINRIKNQFKKQSIFQLFIL
jgi:2-polyprenyl-3-methyl-5-hydroxy-6-metoxy-1,4-benzoquinol methylase